MTRWKRLRCSRCGGSGMVQTMGGVEDCPTCGLTGIEGFITESDRLFLYPTGPLLGSAERGTFAEIDAAGEPDYVWGGEQE